MINAEELFKHGFDEFEVQSYPKGTYLTLKCRDYMKNSDLQVALMHARKIAKNKSYRTFMKIKDSIGYKVLEVQDIIEITIIGIFAIKIKNAWNVIGQGYDNLAKKYKLDIKGKCYERGMEFVEEFEYNSNGAEILYKVHEFKNYQWECECPTLGG